MFKLLFASILLGVSIISHAEPKATVWTGIHNSILTFTQYIDFEVDTKVRNGNDNQYAYEESLNDPNSFLVIVSPTSRFFTHGPNNPLDTMDYVATLGSSVVAFAVKDNSPFNTIEEMVVSYKKSNKHIRMGGSGYGITAGAKTIEKTFGIPVDVYEYKPGVQNIADLNNGNLDIIVVYPRVFNIANSQNQSNADNMKFIGKLSSSDVGPMKNLRDYSINKDGYSIVLFANKKMNPLLRQRMIDSLQSKKYVEKATIARDTTYMSYSTVINKKVLTERIDQEKQLMEFKLN